MKEHNIHGLPIAEKYNKAAAKWYLKKHLAALDGAKFDEAPPAKDWNEAFMRTQNKIITVSEKYEKKFTNIGNNIEKKFDESGWKDKMHNFFMKKMKIEKLADSLN